MAVKCPQCKSTLVEVTVRIANITLMGFFCDCLNNPLVLRNEIVRARMETEKGVLVTVMTGEGYPIEPPRNSN